MCLLMKWVMSMGCEREARRLQGRPTIYCGFGRVVSLQKGNVEGCCYQRCGKMQKASADCMVRLFWHWRGLVEIVGMAAEFGEVGQLFYPFFSLFCL